MTPKTRTAFRLSAATALFALVLGCTPPPDPGTAEGTDDMTALTPEQRADRRQALARQWQGARDRLEELRQKANADGVQDEWDEAVAKIDAEAAELGRELEEYGEDSRESWTDFEARVERSLDAMGREIDQALANIG